MDSKEFREFGKAAVDFIADYMDNIRDLNILPSVSPGYLFDLIPKDIPEQPEKWQDVLEDVNKLIIPGMTHWQSPNMHAYYPTASSFPSIVGEMLSAGFSVIGFSWICSPACTELEVVVMDWLVKFLNLPSHFLHSSEGPGGGVIQGSASECILVAMLSAREQAVKRLQLQYPDLTESDIRGRLVAYSSDQSNSCVEKSGVLAAVPIRLIPVGDDLILHGDDLQKAIDEDLQNGKFPIICVATMGTTGTCASDDITELGPICEKNNVWLHVDAAYAGAGLALPELSDMQKGLELVDTFNFNLHKFMMINFDCGAMWFKDANRVVDSFNVDRMYLKHNYEGNNKIPDFRHWQIPLGRRFRALKVWITCRTIGAEGIRANIRKHIALAKSFEQKLLQDSRFEIVTKTTLGLVCFRAKGSNGRTSNLLQRLTDRKKIYMVKAEHKGNIFLRFAVCGMDPQERDIDFAWKEIEEQLSIVIKAESLELSQKCTTEDVKAKTSLISKPERSQQA